MIRSIPAHEAAILNIKINWPTPDPDDEDDEADYEFWLQLKHAASQAAMQDEPQTVSVAQRQREEFDARFAAPELPEA